MGSGAGVSRAAAFAGQPAHAGAGVQTILMISRLPQAWAYLRRVAKEGECLSFRIEACSGDTALLVVPMRAATSSCVRPACLRASSTALSAGYYSSSPSHAALNPGRCMARASSALVSRGTGVKCSLVMFDLLQALAGSLQFAAGGFQRLLDEVVLDDDLPAPHRLLVGSMGSDPDTFS